MNSRADIKDRRQNIFPKEHKHMPLDSVFGSSRGDDLWFWPFIRVKMAQNQHERSKVPTRCLVHLIQFWSGGKDNTKDGLCVLCAYLYETYTTVASVFTYLQHLLFLLLEWILWYIYVFKHSGMIFFQILRYKDFAQCLNHHIYIYIYMHIY